MIDTEMEEIGMAWNLVMGTCKNSKPHRWILGEDEDTSLDEAWECDKTIYTKWEVNKMVREE